MRFIVRPHHSAYWHPRTDLRAF